MAAAFRAGYVAIVGRPNVGKSTLLNALIGQKLSITSRKPQTTRHRITGILTRPDAQLLFVDTPGFQKRHGSALNRSMNRVVTQSLVAVDAVLLVVEAGHFSAEDRVMLELLPATAPVLLAINKIDKLSDQRLLLPFIQTISAQREFAEIVPISATRGTAVEALVRAITGYLPQQPALHGADEITESSERFLAAELIREKIFRLLGDELPYASTVVIERFETEGALRRIHAAIIVAKESHKGMVIGAGGGRLKTIASKARLDMEKLFGGKVHLEVWVKVKSGWTEDQRLLHELGYAERGRSRQDAQPAFVLHSYPYRETSLVIESFTRNAGRVALVARGARRPRSALRGVLLAFQPLLLSWAGKSELRTLHSAEWQGGLPQLKGIGLLCGFYLNELMVKLLAREDPHEQLFETYDSTLHALAAGGDHAATLRRFEKRFLQELGYALTLDHDPESGEAVLPARAYRYLIDRGPVRCNGESGGSAENQLELSGQTLLDLARDDYSNPVTMQQSKALMRTLLNHYLGSQTLNTRQLLKDLQQL